jgi:hypothetical protein
MNIIEWIKLIYYTPFGIFGYIAGAVGMLGNPNNDPELYMKRVEQFVDRWAFKFSTIAWIIIFALFLLTGCNSPAPQKATEPPPIIVLEQKAIASQQKAEKARKQAIIDRYRRQYGNNWDLWNDTQRNQLKAELKGEG